MTKSRTDRFLDLIRENTRQDNERLRKKAEEKNREEAEEKERKNKLKAKYKKELTKRSPVLKAIGGGGLNPTSLLNKGLPCRKKFKRGGHVKKKKIDGIARKGKTKGRFV